MGKARGSQLRRRGHLFVASLTIAKIRRAECGPSEQGFVVDSFNAQMLSLAQSG
jgi:hypothetical protein